MLNAVAATCNARRSTPRSLTACPEIADALQINERTVRRDWEKARLLLAEMLVH